MSDHDEQPTLTGLDADKTWQKEWQGMPEFVQGRTKPFHQLTVRFATAEDYAAFAALIGQTLTRRTKAIWIPELLRGKHGAKRWTTGEKK